MIRVTVVFALLQLFLVGCSSDSGATGATSLASLPKATGASSASASITKSSRGTELQSATTGTKLTSWYDSFNGQTSKSQTFCQMGANLREVVRSAAQPDKIACYLGVMESFPSLSNWPSATDDGNYHYINLTNAGRSAMKVKFRVVKSGGIITELNMFSGNEGQGQREYVAMSSTDGNVTLTSVQLYTDSRDQTSRGRVTVTGTIGSDGTWTSAKTIVAENSWSQSRSRTQNSRVELTQYSDRFQVQGYSTGSESGNSYTDRFYSLVQLLNPSPLSTMALGEGTAKMSMTHDSHGTFSNTRAWNGDTGNPISPSTSADYYSTVSAATLPSAPSSYNVTFATAETWDLTVPSGSTATDSDLSVVQANAAAAAAFDSCNTKYEFPNGNWPECWSLSQD